MNVEQSKHVPVPAVRSPTEQQQRVVPQQQTPLVREQVVAAATDLSNGVPGSGVVGAGLNSVPYGYYYYYYIPPVPQHQTYEPYRSPQQQVYQQPYRVVPPSVQTLPQQHQNQILPIIYQQPYNNVYYGGVPPQMVQQQSVQQPQRVVPQATQQTQRPTVQQQKQETK